MTDAKLNDFDRDMGLEARIKELSIQVRFLDDLNSVAVTAIEQAETKLAKAVEVLRETDQAIMLYTDKTDWRLWGEVAVSNIRAVLDELEGKTK